MRDAGTLPNGAISGSLSTSNSGATISFAPNNITMGFGTLPGINISGGGNILTHYILNPSLDLQACTVGNPVGQTFIQGAVTAVPEVQSAMLVGAGLAALSLLRRRRGPAR